MALSHLIEILPTKLYLFDREFTSRPQLIRNSVVKQNKFVQNLYLLSDFNLMTCFNSSIMYCPINSRLMEYFKRLNYFYRIVNAHIVLFKKILALLLIFLLPADPKTGGANPTMVRILRSVNTDRMSQPEIIDDVIILLITGLQLMTSHNSLMTFLFLLIVTYVVLWTT